MTRQVFGIKDIIQSIKRYWQDMPLAGKGIVLNSLPLTVLLASLTVIFQSEQQAALLETRVQNALLIQQDIQTLQTELLEASTGVRDFLLTGNRDFLTGYLQAKKNMPMVLYTLEQRLDDKAQQKLMYVVHPLVEKNIDDLTTLANNTQPEANEALINRFLSQTDALSQLRDALRQMSRRESRLIALDKKDVIEERARNLRITLLAMIAGVLGSVIGVLIFSNTIVRRVKIIRDSAILLVKGAPLDLPKISRDELGQLSDELNHASGLLAHSTREVHQARLEAEAANDAKSRFLSRTSHELRTPLNAILGFAQILENELPVGRQKESASRIFNGGSHLLKLINEVLDISMIESGTVNLSIETIALKPLLAEACQLVKPLADKRNIAIQTTCADNIFIECDHQRLLQVMINLLSNAVKYGPGNAMVHLNVNIDNTDIRIEVIDFGPGVPAELRSRLFTPFDRLGAERTMTEGVGLGLALCKQLMDIMGGKIGVSAEKSLFWVSLPVSTHSEHISITTKITAPTTLAFKPVGTRKQQSILYIGQDSENHTLIEAILSKYHHIILLQANTQEAGLHLLQEKNPALILIDFDATQDLGADLVKKIVSQSHHLPIIVFTEDMQKTDFQQLYVIGVNHIFSKPLNVADFNHIITRHMTGSE